MSDALCTLGVAKDPNLLQADSKNSDQRGLSEISLGTCELTHIDRVYFSYMAESYLGFPPPQNSSWGNDQGMSVSEK